MARRGWQVLPKNAMIAEINGMKGIKMAEELRIDAKDRQILRALQRDGRLTNLDLAAQVNLSPSPCLRRVRLLEEAGVIAGYAAIVAPRAVGLRITAFIRVTLVRHDREAVTRFESRVQDIDAILDCHLMTGEADYLLRVVVPDIAAYDAFYKRLIAKIEIRDVSSSFAMEQIKYTTELPLDYIVLDKESASTGA